jgi:hypothetical protein
VKANIHVDKSRNPFPPSWNFNVFTLTGFTIF